MPYFLNLAQQQSWPQSSWSNLVALYIWRNHLPQKPIRISVVRCSNMTVTPKISVNNGNLVVHGKTILTGVPDNIVLTPATEKDLVTGAFIGAIASNSKSLHVFPNGVLEIIKTFVENNMEKAWRRGRASWRVV